MRWSAIAWIALAALSAPPAFAADAPESDSVVELLTLPRGDAERGREAFKELKCSTCHLVAGDVDMPKPVAAKPAPTLGVRQSRYRSGFVSESVIFPSHAVAPGGRDESTGQSRMGDFSDVMTVRQLTDIVAYLKSLDEEV